jgi:hypothetical protein
MLAYGLDQLRTLLFILGGDGDSPNTGPAFFHWWGWGTIRRDQHILGFPGTDAGLQRLLVLIGKQFDMGTQILNNVIGLEVVFAPPGVFHKKLIYIVHNMYPC